MQKAVWLFGENRGATMNNNSWHTFHHLVTAMRNAPIDAFYALERNPANELRVADLPKQMRRRILWHSGRRHRAVFERADRFFITLSFGDIEPRQVAGGSDRRVPLVHLQHGTIGIKAVGYHGAYYRGTLDAFCTYNDEERALLAALNGFSPAQLFDMGFHPRYTELLRRADAAVGSREILWFLTWRDYLADEHVSRLGAGDAALERDRRRFVDAIVDTLAEPALAEELESGDRTLRIGFHQFFDHGTVDAISERLEAAAAGSSLARVRDRVTMSHGAEVDVMDLIARAEMLVTDYSSIAYDVTFLGRPVVLHLFDLDRYLEARTAYVDIREVFTEHVSHAAAELAPAIAAAWGTVHPHYAARVQPVVDEHVRDWVRSGGATRRLIEAMIVRDAPLLAARAAADSSLLTPRELRSGARKEPVVRMPAADVGVESLRAAAADANDLRGL